MKVTVAVKVFKRGSSPFWYAEFMSASGQRKRISTQCTTKPQAYMRLKELVADDKAQEVAKSEMTLWGALDNYHQALLTRGKSSARMVGSVALKIVGRQPMRDGTPRWHLDGGMLLKQLKPQHLEELTRARIKEGSNPTTIGHELKLIRAAVKFASKMGYETPVIHDWAIPRANQKTRFLSYQEYLQVFEQLQPVSGVSSTISAMRQDAQDLLVVLTLSGGRWGEIATLTWDRVDFENRKLQLWGNKTQKERPVPTPDQMWQVLERRREDNKTRKSLYVFPGRNGVKDGLEATRVSSPALTRAINAAGLNTPAMVKAHGKATVHSLRHTYASWLLQGGADLVDVQGALGHTTMAMTRRYAHLTGKQALTRVSSALSNFLATA